MKFFSLEMNDMTARDLVWYKAGGYDYVFDTDTGKSAWLINGDGMRENNRNAIKAVTPQAEIPTKL